MTIALDFDGTWTADPELWRALVAGARQRGHEVVMVTGREGWSPDMERARLPAEMPIVFAGREPKRAAALKAGFQVQVWIDDMPGMIDPGTLLVGDLDG